MHEFSKISEEISSQNSSNKQENNILTSYDLTKKGHEEDSIKTEDESPDIPKDQQIDSLSKIGGQLS